GHIDGQTRRQGRGDLQARRAESAVRAPCGLAGENAAAVAADPNSQGAKRASGNRGGRRASGVSAHGRRSCPDKPKGWPTGRYHLYGLVISRAVKPNG